MKIRYIFLPFENDATGVLKKVLNQTSVLKQLGADIELILVTNETFSLESLNFIKIRRINQCSISNFIQRIKRARQIAGIIKKEIDNLEAGDCLYLRYPYFILYYPKNFFKSKRACKVIFEHNTKEMEELKLVSGLFSFPVLNALLSSNLIRSQSDAFIGVTDDITTYQLVKYRDPKKPHITIGNGIDVNSVPLRILSIDNLNELHLLFVANVSRWHGVDRLIKGLAAYRGPMNITLHIAGDGAELQNLKRIVSELKLSKQVIFHGFTTGKDLDDLFNTCHIAVGSLGIHRIGLTESSTLKVREYCARGIPWIIACKDPDFPEDFPYIYRIPADESPVSIEEVIKFAERMYADPDHPQKMRAYALDHLDWSVKMKKLKTFLESLVDESPS